MAKARSFFSRGRKVKTADRYIQELQRAGLILQRAGNADGAEWIVEDRPMRNFASCSYMGLERHPALISKATAALHEYGSNFSISRAYLECPLYPMLEDALGEVTGRSVLVAPSTTLAHLAALPVLVGDDDLVLIDQFAHASVHMATDLVADVPIELLRHNRTDLLEEKLQEAGDRYERVWYICDGVYSMLGDYAPFDALRDLLARYPRLRVYLDDAHGTSWTGLNGRGAALANLGDCDRVYVAISLNKAFGAVGGALALPTAEERDRIRRCGGPLIFSGPIAPAGLGAAYASATLHLSEAFPRMQAELAERVAAMHSALTDAGIQLASDDRTPIFIVHYDSAATARAVVTALRERGFYTCVSTFPAVPMNKPSLRFTASRHNTLADINALVENLVQVTSDLAPSVFRATTPPSAVELGTASTG